MNYKTSDHERAYRKAYYQRTKERDREKNIDRMIRWQRANTARVNAKSIAWRKKNLARYAAWATERRAVQIMAQPSWVKREELVAFYIEAKRQSLITGIPYEVDHIWPLQGEGFIGLNVPWNLRVIPASMNRKKINKRPDDNC